MLNTWAWLDRMSSIGIESNMFDTVALFRISMFAIAMDQGRNHEGGFFFNLRHSCSHSAHINEKTSRNSDTALFSPYFPCLSIKRSAKDSIKKPVFSQRVQGETVGGNPGVE